MNIGQTVLAATSKHIREDIFSSTATLEELGVDAVGVAEIVMAVEKECGISVSDDMDYELSLQMNVDQFTTCIKQFIL